MAKIKADRIKEIAVTAAVGIGIYYSLAYPAETSAGVKSGIDRCLGIIIPTMYIFLCITTFICMTGIHSIAAKPVRVVSEKIFRIPKEGFAILLLSMVSGYPAGIKLVTESYRNGEITEKQAEVMSCFCYSSGPAFIAGTAGIIYPESNAGMLIFISVTAANIITALIMTRSLPKVKYRKAEERGIKINMLIPSVRSASSAMMQMCIMIVAFGGISSILKISGAIQWISESIGRVTGTGNNVTEDIVMTLLEISNIVEISGTERWAFPIVTFMLSFGGVCVIMQVTALAEEWFSVKRFVLTRLFTASLSGIISYMLMDFSDISVTAGNFRVATECRYSPLPSFMLIIMIVMLLSLPENKNSAFFPLSEESLAKTPLSEESLAKTSISPFGGHTKNKFVTYKK